MRRQWKEKEEKKSKKRYAVVIYDDSNQHRALFCNTLKTAIRIGKKESGYMGRKYAIVDKSIRGTDYIGQAVYGVIGENGKQNNWILAAYID